MKYSILATDSNREYFELLPLVCYSWKKIGYKPMLLAVNTPYEICELIQKHSGCSFYRIESMEGVKDSTLAQVWRLFAFKFLHKDYEIVTGDADMVIGKDIFSANYSHDKIVSYGFDLTGRGELPICYIQSSGEKWCELMGQEFWIDDRGKSADWNFYWNTDQQMLTNKAKEYGLSLIKFVDRGHQPHPETWCAKSRWDRHKWDIIPSDIIDVHMKRNDFDAQLQVFKRLWPNDDYQFLIEFKRELDLLSEQK